MGLVGIRLNPVKIITYIYEYICAFTEMHLRQFNFCKYQTYLISLSSPAHFFEMRLRYFSHTNRIICIKWPSKGHGTASVGIRR